MKHIRTKEEKELRDIVASERMTLVSSLIEKAQEFTGLETRGIRTLLKKAKSIQRQKLYEDRRKLYEERRKKANKFGFRTIPDLERAEEKAHRLLKMFGSGYNMGDYKRLYLDDQLFVTRDTTQTYSGEWKGSEIYGEIIFKFTKREFNALEVINWVWTITRPNTDRVWYFIEQGQKQHYRIKKIDGWCIEGAHGITKQKAEQALKTRKQAERRAEIYRRLQSFPKEDRFEYLQKRCAGVFVGLKHIEKVGACDPGIDNFCSRHKLDKNLGYRLDYLLTLEPGNRFLENACYDRT